MSKRKFGFHSKHNAVTLFQKTHTTHDTLSFGVSLASLATSHGFACNCRALMSLCSCTPLLPPPFLYIQKKRMARPASLRVNLHAERVMKTNPHFVCGAGLSGWAYAERVGLLCHPYFKVNNNLLSYFSLPYN